MAINAGQDMLAICASVDAIHDGYESVSKGVKDGSISEERLDESVSRILTLKSSIPERLAFDLGKLEQLQQQIINLNNNLN